MTLSVHKTYITKELLLLCSKVEEQDVVVHMLCSSHGLCAVLCCRLLRNRVSAQQARERKKQYVTTLEEQVKEQQARIAGGLLGRE
jgi:transcription factor HY5